MSPWAYVLYTFNSVSFYRVTLCVNAIFAVSGCLSVCLSVMWLFVYCIHIAKDVIKLFSPHGSTIILVFLAQAPIPNSKENSLSGGVKYTRSGNIFAILDWNRHLSMLLFSRHSSLNYGAGRRPVMERRHGVMVGILRKLTMARRSMLTMVLSPSVSVCLLELVYI